MVIDTKSRVFVLATRQEMLCLPVCPLLKWSASIKTSGTRWIWMHNDADWLSVFHLERLYKWASFALKHPGNEMECVLKIISPFTATKYNFFDLELRISFTFAVTLSVQLMRGDHWEQQRALFAPVGEDNTCNKVSSSFSSQPENPSQLPYPSPARAGMWVDGRSGRMIKSLVPIESA